MGQVEVEWTYREQGGDSIWGDDQREPVQEDFFQHIYNINWVKGGIFVVRTWFGDVLRGDVKSKDDFKFTGLIKVGKKQNYPPGAANSGSSYALIKDIPIFVAMVYEDADDPRQSASAIYISNDGKSWQRTLRVQEENIQDGFPNKATYDIEPTGVVFVPDPAGPDGEPTGGTFYASMYVGEVRFRAAGDNFWYNDYADGEYIYSSRNGQSWSRITNTVAIRRWKGNENGQLGDGMRDSDPSSLRPYCTKPNNDGGMPDGLQAYSKLTDTFIKPADLAGFSPVNGALYHGRPPSFDPSYPDPGWQRTPSSSLTIRPGVKGGTAAPALGEVKGNASGPCWAVGCVGNIWVAAGVNVDVWLDEDKGWQKAAGSFGVGSGGGGFDVGEHYATVVGGKRSDVKAPGGGEQGGQGGTPAST